MTGVVIVGDKIAEQYGERLRQLSHREAARVMARALNRGGDTARTQVKRSLVAQTGIKYGLINKAVTTIPATPGRLEYSLVAQGNETNLNLFGAKQGKRGVSAAPWKKKRVFKGTFIVPAYGAKVFRRETDARGPLDPLWGPNIARELIRSPTIEQWAVVGPNVINRVGHELMRMFHR
jgi:hypothetical protein